MNAKSDGGGRTAMLVVLELDRDLLAHFGVREWNEFIGELVRRDLTPVAWAQGERPPPVGVMFDFRGLRSLIGDTLASLNVLRGREPQWRAARLWPGRELPGRPHPRRAVPRRRLGLRLLGLPRHRARHLE